MIRIGFDKIAYAIAALGIIAAPALLDKTSIAAKAEGAARIAESRAGQGVHVPVMQSDDPSCRVIVSRERGLDGSILIRRVPRCG
jgi:hypothetical protein